MPQKFDLEAALAKDVGPRRVVIYYIFIQLNILTKRFQPTSFSANVATLRRWEELKTRRDVRREYVPSIYDANGIAYSRMTDDERLRLPYLLLRGGAPRSGQ